MIISFPYPSWDPYLDHVYYASRIPVFTLWVVLRLPVITLGVVLRLPVITLRVVLRLPVLTLRVFLRLKSFVEVSMKCHVLNFPCVLSFSRRTLLKGPFTCHYHHHLPLACRRDTSLTIIRATAHPLMKHRDNSLELGRDSNPCWTA